jgi:type II secretory pathway predicted ATPase ExeA
LYETHFGLTPRPFGDTSRPEAYVALASRDAALRRIRYGLEHGGGPALLFGAIGSGKTTLAHALARELNWPATHLVFPAMPAAEFLSYFGDELHAPPAEPGLSGSLRRVRRALDESARREGRLLLVVDEAHLIDDPATFEALRLLLNFTDGDRPGLGLLIVGGPEVLLQIPPALSDRLAARAMLGPFTAEESALYVLGRLASAGARRLLFDPEALAELHRSADGLPRRLNRLADLALLIAYAEGRDRPDAVAVEIAAREAAFEPISV